ncbi:MAG: class I SAM-dependent methyltransferase [Bacteroidales bacterium]
MHTSCLLCSSSSLKQVTSVSRIELIQCQKCSFVFCKNIPSELELTNYYKNYGKNNYLSPLTVKRYNELLNYFEKYRKTNKILDVGCGHGFFLNEAKKRGWEVWGTDYSDVCQETCIKNNINFHKGDLKTNDYLPESFDVITSFEVIEHTNTPKHEINKFEYLLRSGGIVYITTPNFNSISRSILKDTWSIITYPEHLSYFTAKTLNFLLVNNGFKKVKIQTTGFSLTRYKRAVQKSNQAYISPTSDDEKLRVKADTKILFKTAKFIINTILTFLKKGDTIKAFYVKK